MPTHTAGPGRPRVDRGRRRLGVALAVAATVLGGCSTDATLSDPPVEEDPAETVTPDAAVEPDQVGEPGGGTREFFSGVLAVEGQTTDGASVAVDRAGVDDVRGWLVIRRTADGEAPGEVLGSEPLPAAGPEDDLTVELDPPLDGGTHTLFAGVHQDAEPVRELDLQSSDNLVANEAGDTLTATFEVTVTSEAAG